MVFPLSILTSPLFESLGQKYEIKSGRFKTTDLLKVGKGKSYNHLLLYFPYLLLVFFITTSNHQTSPTSFTPLVLTLATNIFLERMHQHKSTRFASRSWWIKRNRLSLHQHLGQKPATVLNVLLKSVLSSSFKSITWEIFQLFIYFIFWLSYIPIKINGPFSTNQLRGHQQDRRNSFIFISFPLRNGKGSSHTQKKKKREWERM